MEKHLIKSSSFPKVLIIGCGIGGIELAKRLKGKEVEITMLARHNYSGN
jgi:NADH dehydrogenase